MPKAFVLLLVLLSVSGCGAVYAWDTMQLRSVQKQAAQKLMDDCSAGDKQACAYVAGQSIGTR